MKKTEILKILRKIAKKDGLLSPEIMKIDDEGVMTMFVTKEGFPPVWFRFFSFEQLKGEDHE